jgi:outer membrane protein TolC
MEDVTTAFRHPAAALWHAGLILAAASTLLAQISPPSSGSSSSRPIALPESGRDQVAGSVSIQQSTSPSGSDTLNSSVETGGALQGSVPGANPPAGSITLTLADAVERGLKTNLGIMAADASSASARAQRIQMLSALLPNLSANTSESIMQVNLAAYGFKFNVPASLGFAIPTVVGPFSYWQAQGAVSQSIWDPVARSNWKATREAERAAVLSAKDARELVVVAVGGAYLQAVATAARIESQRAQVANAQAIYDQAQVRKTAGTNARIDVMRTLVELQTEQQRLSSLESDYRQQRLALAGAIGLPLDREITLSEPLAPEAVPLPDPQEAIAQAMRLRSDLRAAEAQVDAARQAVAAARGERLPSLDLNGNYGVSGPNPASIHTVYTGTVSLNVPIWEGGRVKGDIEQAEATLRQRESELADQRRRVEQEVRSALMMLETALGQMKVAGSNRAYAAETLRESRDRFSLGVANTVEVVQAEQQVAAAESDYVSSLLSLDLARLNLSKTLGQAESSLPDLLRNARKTAAVSGAPRKEASVPSLTRGAYPRPLRY